jgi:hypothetical protein
MCGETEVVDDCVIQLDDEVDLTVTLGVGFGVLVGNESGISFRRPEFNVSITADKEGSGVQPGESAQELGQEDATGFIKFKAFSIAKEIAAEVAGFGVGDAAVTDTLSGFFKSGGGKDRRLLSSIE